MYYAKTGRKEWGKEKKRRVDWLPSKIPKSCLRPFSPKILATFAEVDEQPLSQTPGIPPTEATRSFLRRRRTAPIPGVSSSFPNGRASLSRSCLTLSGTESPRSDRSSLSKGCWPRLPTTGLSSFLFRKKEKILRPTDRSSPPPPAYFLLRRIP